MDFIQICRDFIFCDINTYTMPIEDNGTSVSDEYIVTYIIKFCPYYMSVCYARMPLKIAWSITYCDQCENSDRLGNLFGLIRDNYGVEQNLFLCKYILR